MRTFKPILLCLAVSGGLLALALLPQRPLFAAPSAHTFIVNTTDDRLDADLGDGECHTSVDTCALRAAIMQANHLTGPGVTTIMLPAGTFTLTRPISDTNGEDSGDLNLTTPLSPNQSVSLLGAGANVTIIDADQIDRVLFIALDRVATISDVTLRNGYAGDLYGGALYNVGSLTVTNSLISGNHADTAGGGLFNSNHLTLINSTISDNTTGGDGAGLYNAAVLTIINSTISHNDANVDGGGLGNESTANIYNTTIVFNGANADDNLSGVGGGVFSDTGATTNLRNSLVAGNTIPHGLYEDNCSGTLGMYGVNLIGSFQEAFNVCTLGGPGFATFLNSLDYLGELQDNGGPTWTHALLVGSNAIDGDNLSSPMACIDPGSNPLLTDQRGYSRAAGSSCDVGAFEYQLPLFLPLVVR